MTREAKKCLECNSPCVLTKEQPNYRKTRDRHAVGVLEEILSLTRTYQCTNPSCRMKFAETQRLGG